MVNVLFVCTGNICRSPTAEGVFAHLVAEAGLADAITTDSAGTHGYHVGHPPDDRAIALAQARGIDLSRQRARKLLPADFKRFDRLVGMDAGHLLILRGLAGQAFASKLSLLLDHAQGHGRDVPDPYYGDSRDFERAYALIEAGARGLLASIRADLGSELNDRRGVGGILGTSG